MLLFGCLSFFTTDAGSPPTTPSRSPGLLVLLEASTPVVVTPEAPSASGIQEASDMSTDDSMEDITETESIERFMHDSCGARLGLRTL